MSLELTNSSKFIINEISMITKTGKLDLSGVFEELNLFDSIFVNVMNGNILITDSIGLSGKFLFDGSEAILIDISKGSGSTILNFKKAFRIYKQTDRETLNKNSERYILHFVSDEMIFSEQQLVNQAYKTTYDDVARKILLNYLKIPATKQNGLIEKTVGIRDIVVPNLRPLEAVEWCAKRAIDSKRSPNYMFFENNIGYNFASLSTLLSQKELFTIKFPPKNLEQTNVVDDLFSPKHFEVITQTDKIQTTRSGVNAGTFIGFDPITRTIATRKIGYEDHYSKMKHANDNPNYSAAVNKSGIDASQAYDSKKTVSSFGSFRKESAYIKKYDPTSISKIEAQEDFIFQRKAIIANLMNKRIKLVMPGNFQMTSGFVLNVRVPNSAVKSGGDDNEDRSLSGRYLITATRHIINYEKHETVLELATTSNELEFIPSATNQQTREIDNYGSY
jgi:hypothetical protein